MYRALVNGAEQDVIGIDDRGLRYGDGLFETIAVRAGKPCHWDRHWSRLQHGALRLAIPMPPTIEDEARRVCAGASRAVLRIILTRGSGGQGYAADDSVPPNRIVSLLPWRERPSEWARDGVAVRLCRTRLARNPLLAGLKHLNRLEQVLARAEWRDEFAEGVMRSEEGDVIEGTMSNLFLVRDSELVTPELKYGGVEGVMRSLVFDYARRLGRPVRIGCVTPDNLAQAEEVFLTNSLIGVWPVQTLNRQVEGQGTVQFAVGKVTRELQDAMTNG